MSDTKELWFVRHTETVTPESYDFDLSRLGKRRARMLGWYLAEQCITGHSIVFHAGVQRAAFMAETISDCLDKKQPLRTVISARGTLPPRDIEGFTRLVGLIRGLDGQRTQIEGMTPSTAIFVVHRAYDEACTLFCFLMASEKGRSLGDGPQQDRDFTSARRYINQNYKNYRHGELVHIRFKVQSWAEIAVGTGEIIERKTPKTIRPVYRAARQGVSTLQQTP